MTEPYRPPDTPEEEDQEAVWADFLFKEALQNRSMHEAFTQATGIHHRAVPEDLIHRLQTDIVDCLDSASAYALLFLYWVTLVYWGKVGVPSNFLDAARSFFPKEAATLD